MNTMLLESAFNNLLQHLDKMETINAICSFSSEYKGSNAIVKTLLTLPKDQILQNITNVNDIIISFVNSFKSKIQPRICINEIDSALKICSELQNNGFIDASNTVSRFMTLLENFLRSYEIFLTTQSQSNAINFAFDIERLRNHYSKMKTIGKILNSLCDTSDFKEDENNFIVTIGFSKTIVSMSEIATKLSGFECIYNAIAQLIPITNTVNPLRVIKIETGSTWIKALGSKIILPILIEILGHGADYQFDQYIKHQTIVSFEEIDIDSLDKLINLRNKLNNSGFDTSELDAKITIALKVIGRALDDTLKGEPKIQINGQVHSIQQEDEKLYLEATSKTGIETRDIQELRHD